MKTTDTATTTAAADQVANSTTNDTTAELTEDAIRLRAYSLWQAAGQPSGWEDHFWVRAEGELKVKALAQVPESPSNSPLNN